MYLLSPFKLFLLLFVSMLCDQMNEEEPMPDGRSMIVSVRYDCKHENNPNTHCCDGTILTESYVLTAADCVESFPSDITIAAGFPNGSESNQITRKIDQVIIHPNWTNGDVRLKDNIALLHLSDSLDMTRNKYLTRAENSTHPNLSDDVLRFPSNSARLVIMKWNFSIRNFDIMTRVNQQQSDMSLVDQNDPICKALVYDIEQQFCVRVDHDSESLFCKKIIHSISFQFLQVCVHVRTMSAMKDVSEKLIFNLLDESGESVLQWINSHWLQVKKCSF